jgi:Uma2 family endonuclease
MVGCDARDTASLYLCYPKILIEVTSDSTERLDRHEKRSAYQTIETLEEYLIASQDRHEATIFRRGNNWAPEVFTREDQALTLNSISLDLPLSLIYEGVSAGASAAQ